MVVYGDLQVQVPGHCLARLLQVVALPEDAAVVLRRWRIRQAEKRLRAGDRWRDEGWVFTMKTGGPLMPRNADRWLQAIRRAGLSARGYGWHPGRHTAAGVLLSSGVPPLVAAKYLGHRWVSTFYEVYADLLEPASREAADKVSGFWRSVAQKAPGRGGTSTRRGNNPQVGA